MDWARSGRAPKEAPAGERAIDMPPDGIDYCLVCGSSARVHRLPIPGLGKEWVCVEPTPCLDRIGYVRRWW